MGVLNDATINKLGKVANEWFSGIAGTAKRMSSQEMIGPLAKGEVRGMDKGMGMIDAIKEAHRVEPGQMAIGGYSAKKMAGSYMGVSTAGRIATGGGLYKDKDGNSDIIGLPFI